MSERVEGAGRGAASERQRRLAVAREAIRRADALGADASAAEPLPAGALRADDFDGEARPCYSRWGWRRGLRFAIEHRTLTLSHLVVYGRYAWHRLWQPEVDFQGLAFIGCGVELLARPGYGRLVIGSWRWIGAGNSLRAHEGSARLGEKVVLGSNNVVNGYLDIEIGADARLSDWIYICDFDHHFEYLSTPIRKQGLRKSPVRIGENVWVGEKVAAARSPATGCIRSPRSGASYAGAHEAPWQRERPSAGALGSPISAAHPRLDRLTSGSSRARLQT